jgi:hypothetical protein
MSTQNHCIKDKQKKGERANKILELTCPYWEPEFRSCRLVKDGIFLPINAQISNYCLTGQHALCDQYRQLTTQDKRSEQAGRPLSNRRKTMRIPCCHIFRFAEITDSDQIDSPSSRENNAWTVDCSVHGIRCVTRQMIPPETALQFEVIKDTGEGSMPGFGRVVWSEPLADSILFHSGILFTV